MYIFGDLYWCDILDIGTPVLLSIHLMQNIHKRYAKKSSQHEATDLPALH